MKRILAALAVAALATSSHAVDLALTSPVATGLNPVGSFDVAVAGFSATNGTIGTLNIDGPGVVTFTFLGKEAGYTNYFFNVGGTDQTIFNTDSAGSTSVQIYATAGILNFSFGTSSPSTGSVVTNGSATDSNGTFAVFAGGSSGYRYVLGFDDRGAISNGITDRDFDDMVIGVSVSPVPEPGTYAMLLAGLGVMGFVMRRRLDGQA
jgi:hypothetical protein